MEKLNFNLTPGPRILLVLTQTAMKPIDALCELVDNAIDSFHGSGKEGVHEIRIEVPTVTGVNRGGWCIRVSDNGPGMSPEKAEKALTASYSGQNQFDRLGLFGVGLNIASGKFARKTKLITAEENSSEALIVPVDLDKLVEQKNFEIEGRYEPSERYFPNGGSGTIIELSERWPQGNVNHDFPKKLVQHGLPRLRDALGRRYATLLRSDSHPRFKIFLGNEECQPFEHCIWGPHRYVERQGNKIYAQMQLNELIKVRNRCMECGAEAGSNGKCRENENHTTVGRVEERVHGWIGVQRYDDNAHFGIDLIRNGRAIRILEKDAFFNFVADDGEIIKDYPVDSQYGRIIGEVHLDHVPVNFTKQDFERLSFEWQEAMSFLRGNSSLQPAQAGASDNNSPVKKIYDGYRRVRRAGPNELYMAERKGETNETKRIDRTEERDLLSKFHDKIPGYHDDAEWFKRVFVATQDNFQDCPNPDCDAKNPPSAEECQVCQHLLKSKECISSECGQKIPQSAEVCRYCGTLQVAEGPWQCGVCKKQDNAPDVSECTRCGSARGSVNPFDWEVLHENSSPDGSLSVREVEIELPDGSWSKKFDLHVRNASLRKGNVHLPAVVMRDPDISKREMTVFLDKSHTLFLSLQMQTPHVVAAAAADWIYADSAGIASGAHRNEHNLVVLAWKVVEKYWEQHLSDDADRVRDDIRSLLDDVQNKMSVNLREYVADIFSAMSTEDNKFMVSSMKDNGVDISKMMELRENGKFMLHIPPSRVVAIFREHTSSFFGGKVWKPSWNIPLMQDENVASHHQSQLKKTYLNCLEDCVSFLDCRQPSYVVVRRARLSVEFLTEEFSE